MPLREGAFSFTRMTLFPPLDKRNTRDKAKGLLGDFGEIIGELGVRCLSTLNREQDSKAIVSIWVHASPLKQKGCTSRYTIYYRTFMGNKTYSL